MQACRFTITTAVDEKENTVIYYGKIDVSETMVVLTYEEGASQICITLPKADIRENNCPEITRTTTNHINIK